MRSRIVLLAAAALLGGTAAAYADVPAFATTNTRLHTDPSAHATIVAHVPARSRLSVSRCEGRWCFARWDGSEGYVSENLLDFPNGSASVDVDSGGPVVERTYVEPEYVEPETVYPDYAYDPYYYDNGYAPGIYVGGPYYGHPHGRPHNWHHGNPDWHHGVPGQAFHHQGPHGPGSHGPVFHPQAQNRPAFHAPMANRPAMPHPHFNGQAFHGAPHGNPGGHVWHHR